MNEYTFTLILDRDPEDLLDALFEAGCDDALFGDVDGTHYAEFTREADTLASAVASAISNIQSVDDLHVLRVEPDDLVTLSEIAHRLDRTREGIRLIAAGQRGDGDFPTPISHTRERNRLWRWTDVIAWAAAHGHVEDADLEGARVIAAVNAALELNARLPQLPEDERNAVAALST